MRLAAQLCTAAAAIVSMMLAEGRVEQWEVDYTVYMRAFICVRSTNI